MHIRVSEARPLKHPLNSGTYTLHVKVCFEVPISRTFFKRRASLYSTFTKEVYLANQGPPAVKKAEVS